MATQNQNPFLVPPPPPNMPILVGQGLASPNPFLQALQPQSDPSVPSAPAPVALPNNLKLPAPTATADSQAFLDLKNKAMKSQQLADTLSDQLTNYAPQQDLTMPTSPFEATMSDALSKKMTSLLSADSTPGARFDKGFDLGQRLAANILVPLLGATTKNGGKAMGYADAIDNLKQQSIEADRTRVAKRQAQNAALAEMSNLWSNMSPESSKNLLAIAQKNLELRQKNMQQKTDLQRNVLTAQHDATEDQNKYFDALSGLDKNSRDTAVAQFNADLALARAKQQQGNQGFDQSIRSAELANQQKRTGIEQANSDLAAEEATTKKQQFGKTQDLEQQKLQLTASKEVLARASALAKDLSATNMFGQPKYGNLLDRLMNNPAYIEETNQLLDKAGLKGKVNAQDMLQSLGTNLQSKQPQAQGQDVLSGIANSVKSIFGATPAQAVPKQQDAHAAIAQFETANKRQPTPEELVKLMNGGQ